MCDKEAYEGELKDLRRWVRESNHESTLMERELRATKHTLWMTRAKYADLMSCKEFYNEYKREHPHSRWNFVCMGFSYATSFTNWSRWFQHISRTCLQNAKEFE